MQGVELKGFAIWVINRDGNSPLKAYKHIKDLGDLQDDSEVNRHIQSMAESIVRAEIANLGINEVIAERKKVRDSITAAMQEILSGWGIWLETVEITEVKILSGSLFNNLQQPYRSQQRQVCLCGSGSSWCRLILDSLKYRESIHSHVLWVFFCGEKSYFFFERNNVHQFVTYKIPLSMHSMRISSDN